MDILMGIESVLEDESKSSTYKFALLTAIVDYIIENPSENPRNGFHFIPLIYLAKRWLYYYYPIVLYGTEGIKQGNPKIALTRLIREFAKSSTDNKIPYFDPISIILIRDLIESNEKIESQLIRLIIKIRRKILEQPLQYIKIGGNELSEKKVNVNFKIKQTSFTLFGLTNVSLSNKSQYDYDYTRKNSMSWPNKIQNSNWTKLKNRETSFITMGHYTFVEIMKSRFFIRDTIIKRWIEFSVNRYLSKDGRATYALIEGLNMHLQKMERDAPLIAKIRNIVSDIFKPLSCIYCGKSLKSFELDHFVPWSKYPVNKFWNLYPSCKECNNAKRDHLIEIDEMVEEKLSDYLDIWLNYFRNNKETLLLLADTHFDYIANNNIRDTKRYLIEQLKEIVEYII